MTGSKVYVEIVNQIREMIIGSELKSGDKLPSERELTERLGVGRSSVREALRALELLGLIETRRGEGTFIKDFRNHQLLHLLSTFILQDKKAKRDVVETKNLIEMDCLLLMLGKMQEDYNLLLKKWLDSDKIDIDDFFYQIIEMSGNHLLLRIWVILKDFCETEPLKNLSLNKLDYVPLLQALEARDEGKTLAAYWELRKLSLATWTDSY